MSPQIQDLDMQGNRIINLGSSVISGTNLVARLQAGWIPLPTCTYASATTFTLPGDYSAIIGRGDKLEYTQTTVKYAYIYSSAYNAGTGLTTVTIIASSDYTLANAAITAPYFSKEESPFGFLDSFNYVPTLTGFSANPGSATYRFSIKGRRAKASAFMPANGTSNANTFTISAPVVSLINAGGWGTTSWFALDNSAVLTTPACAFISNNSTTISLYKNSDLTANAWTTSGGKRACFDIEYEI